ncbi:hypothetical protein FHT85_005873 [Rhizobium sp. BK312]|uniref:Transposase IS66 C-terminal domain-containing protein n=1 Tax=Rhizobium miluonense TaxID=411945 RepID=A0ABU1SX32_9HYPH|nr:hypothetical protein [Rhizobium sp. BK312]MDR6903531.1 hypothetical protein [Rhizobium miluonense]
MSAKLNDINPQAWLAAVLARIADTPISKLQQLLPWNWQPHGLNAQAPNLRPSPDAYRLSAPREGDLDVEE